MCSYFDNNFNTPQILNMNKEYKNILCIKKNQRLSYFRS